MTEKWTAEHTPGGLIIRDAHGKFIAMSYAPTTQEEKDNLEMILNAPIFYKRFSQNVKIEFKEIL